MGFTDECYRNQPPEVITSQFGFFSLESEFLYMPGRLFIPDEMVPGESYPLVITLHGAGERGTDNQSQVLYNHLATTWAAYEWQADHPCFVFSPQCIYDQRKEKAFSQASVRLDRENMVVTGDGFAWSRHHEVFTIFTNAKVVIKDLKKRVDTGEE